MLGSNYWRDKMIIEDTKGNLFDVEAVLAHERDPTELKLLANCLYEKLCALRAEVEIDIRKTGGNVRLEGALTA